MKYTDSSGHWVESALDIAFIAYGLYDISQNGLNWENGLSLAADVAGLILPGVTGGGWLVRAAFRADEVAALARADEAVEFVQQSANAAQAANQAGNAMQGASQSARPPAAPNQPTAGTSCATNSFTGDTLVATPDGLVPIASLEVGDWVLAYDKDTQQLGAYPVEATWSHEASQLVYLTIDGELIRATANHPIYALGRGWVDAGALVPGDRLIEADGELGVVQALSVAGEQAVVYNLTVTDAHTYFVGEEQWWVHNCGTGPGNSSASHTVYEGRRGGQTVYFGITNDFNRRAQEHGERFDEVIELVSDLTRYDARNLEQALIVTARDAGRNLDNALNSLSPRRADYLARLERGRELIRQFDLLKE